MSDYINEFSASLLGAAVGALSAFGLDAWRASKKEKDEQFNAITRTLLALITQASSLRSVKLQHIDKFESDPERHKNLISFYYSPNALRVDIPGIEFLLKGKTANLVQDVHLAQESYFSAIASLNDRNQMYHKFFEEAEIVQYDPKTKLAVISLQSSGAIMREVMLSNATDALYDLVNKSVERLEETAAELRLTGKQLFKGRLFLYPKRLDVSTPENASDSRDAGAKN